jgi:hypothetical protein
VPTQNVRNARNRGSGVLSLCEIVVWWTKQQKRTGIVAGIDTSSLWHISALHGSLTPRSLLVGLVHRL